MSIINFIKYEIFCIWRLIVDEETLKKLWNYGDKKVIAAIIFCLIGQNSEESLKQLAELQALLDKKD